MKKKKNVFRCFKVIIFAKKNGILYRKKIEIGQPMDRLALHKKMKSSFKDFLSKYEQSPHPTIACSKSTIETLEQGVKYVQT